jgi:iron complex outermembrane recepter protein
VKRFVLVLAVCATFALPAGAKGQSVPDTLSAITGDTVRVESLDRIVITALRLPAELGGATYAAARNGPDVTRRARPGLGLAEPLHGIAGVQVDNRYNFSLGERITVRGFGARTQFGVRGVRILVDGIPATMPDGQTTLNHLDLGRVHAVEVIRTPVAAVYGNAAGGVISVQTAPAPAAPIAADMRLVSGSNGLRRRQLGVGGTTPEGTYLLTVGRLDYDGFRAHNSATNRYFSARTGTELGTAELSLAVHQVQFDALNPGALPDSMVRSDPSAAFPNNVAQNTGQSGRHSQAGVTFNQPLGRMRLSTAAYGVRRRFENPILPRIIDLSRRAGGGRVVLGSNGHSTRVEWDAGVETAVQKDERANYANVAGDRGAVTLDQDERVSMRAGFAAARGRILDRLTVEVGIRRDATEFSVRDRLITETNPDDSGEREMRAWSPSIGISTLVTPRLRLFANLGAAFETPTTTELANRPDGAGGFNPDLRPQRTRSREIGVNGFARNLFYQGAVYHSRVTGSLVPFEVPGTPGRQFFRNAASATHRGAELMVGGSPVAGITARVAYTYTDARYDDYAVGETSFHGHRIPGVAPQLLETLLRFATTRAFLDVETRYQARMPVNDDNTAHSAAYAVHGLRAGFGTLRLGGFAGMPYLGVENILDRRYNSSVTVNAAAGRYYEPGPPRALYAGVDLSLQSGEAGRAR